MNIDYRIGDMFKGGHKYIAHGCNAQGVMGSGVARIVNDNYHYAYLTYRGKYDRVGLKLGEVVVAKPEVRQCMSDPFLPTIFNCITQDHYGTDQRYANYGAIQACIKWIDRYMWVEKGPVGSPIEVAFPMIGAGLAGGDWGIISQIIEREAKHFIPVVYDFTP